MHSFDHVGAWKAKKLMEQLSIDSMLIRPGCVIYFQRDSAGNFVGSTNGSACRNSEYTAMYASSEMFVSPRLVTVWDRGWDRYGKQVWGPRLGAYRFTRFK